ncbi:hypothetical protein SEA_VALENTINIPUFF_84 [Microbacterium phage ValentiniPuff]|uniref:Uncharacterized protein n=1 Tax=Microbacterium phage ValentiniPuff TaxID=2315705 RepID=A0A386KQY5_9CAUD|nr:hypothetical protein SEA_VALENTINIPUFF_84 [Microbacterium phage ValentiniPuff]
MAMSLQEARDGIGRRVRYESEAQRKGRDKRPAELGTIKSVGQEWIFVIYDVSKNTAATRPEDLTFEVPAVDDDDRKDKLLDAREALDTMKEHS